MTCAGVIEYQTWNPTLQDYVLIAQARPQIEHYVRQPDGAWAYKRYVGLDAVVTLASIQCTLKLADVYGRIEFAAEGGLSSLGKKARAALFDRSTSSHGSTREQVAGIISRVRREGDRALLEFARSFDGVTLTRLEVPRAAWHDAVEALAPGVRSALERAAANIRAVHEAQRPAASELVTAVTPETTGSASSERLQESISMP